MDRSSIYCTTQAGATLYKLHRIMNKKLNVGNKVTFDNDKIELFKAETSSTEKAVQQYQKLVLGGVNQIGIVKDLEGNLTTVSYPDGWDLPVPTKYLVVLP